jgi:hypothetical protein
MTSTKGGDNTPFWLGLFWALISNKKDLGYEDN